VDQQPGVQPVIQPSLATQLPFLFTDIFQILESLMQRNRGGAA
jgi:hypothetical protein